MGTPIDVDHILQGRDFNGPPSSEVIGRIGSSDFIVDSACGLQPIWSHRNDSTDNTLGGMLLHGLDVECADHQREVLAQTLEGDATDAQKLAQLKGTVMFLRF